MNLIKEDYSNILKLLEGVEIKGVQSAKYLAVLAHKIENRVATWFDGHPSGYQVQDVPKDIPTFSGSINAVPGYKRDPEDPGITDEYPEPPVELN